MCDCRCSADTDGHKPPASESPDFKGGARPSRFMFRRVIARRALYGGTTSINLQCIAPGVIPLIRQVLDA